MRIVIKRRIAEIRHHWIANVQLNYVRSLYTAQVAAGTSFIEPQNWGGQGECRTMEV